MSGVQRAGGRRKPRDQRRAEFARYKEDVKSDGEAVPPVRDVPRHGHVARRRRRDHRPRLHLVLHVGRGGGRLRASSGRATRPRPTRRRSRSSRGRTGTSTSSSTCCGSSSGPSRSCSARSASRRSRSSCCSPCRSSTGAASAGCSHRPVAVIAAILVDRLDGRPHLEGRDREGGLAARSSAHASTAGSQEQQPARGRPAGRRHLRAAGCLNCHTYLGAGSPNLGAPELTEEGREGRGIEWQIGHLK